jgi:cytochrome c-type biogenesis protein CcmH
MTTDLATLRRQLRQLDELHASGALGADAHATSKAQLEKRIVEHVMQGGDTAPAAAVAAGAAPPTPAPRLPRRLLAAIAVGVVAFGVAGYWWPGSPELVVAPPSATAPQAGGGDAAHETGAAQIAAMVERLASRLQERPEDAEGWAMLARSYAVLGRHADAVGAYRKALALGGENAGVLADLADAIGVVNGRSLAGEPTRLVERALKLDPDHVKALALAGTAAYDRKDYAGAARHWERILKVAPADSDYLAQVRASIADARQLGGLPPAKTPSQ